MPKHNTVHSKNKDPNPPATPHRCGDTDEENLLIERSEMGVNHSRSNGFKRPLLRQILFQTFHHNQVCVCRVDAIIKDKRKYPIITKKTLTKGVHHQTNLHEQNKIQDLET